jgi:hypothetical protein
MKIRIYNHKISNVTQTVPDLLKVTNCFLQRVTYVQGEYCCWWKYSVVD